MRLTQDFSFTGGEHYRHKACLVHMVRALLCTTVLLHGLLAFGQREAHTWYFGPDGAGLDFNTCPPTVVEDGLGAAAFEGSCTISHPLTGELLFYTTGNVIINAQHQVMVNGEPSGLGNTMAQNVIVPKPGSSTQYLVFTPDVQGGLVLNTDYPTASGLNMAVVDMSLANGLGAVVQKFIPVRPPPKCEMLTAVRHANGEDFWLIGHVFGSNEFFVYAITADGLAPEPSLQAIGPVIDTPQPGTPDGSNFDAIGQLKASPQGDRLAFTTFYNGRTAVFDFDASTGVLSDPLALSIGKGGYGVCFSPGGSKLYVTARDSADYGTMSDADLFQFDLTAGGPAAVQASRYAVFSPSLGGFASMRLGPDQRIYVARVGSDSTPAGDEHLGVVQRPELAGAACDYVHDGIHLNGQRGSWGLNNMYETSGDCSGFASLPNERDPRGPIVVVPRSSGVQVSWPIGVKADALDVFDVEGRLVFTKSLGTSEGAALLPLRGTDAGCYVVRLRRQGAQVMQQRFVVMD